MRNNIRNEALKLYTDILSSNITNENDGAEKLNTLISLVGDDTETMSIVADMFCKFYNDEMLNEKFNLESIIETFKELNVVFLLCILNATIQHYSAYLTEAQIVSECGNNSSKIISFIDFVVNLINNVNINQLYLLLNTDSIFHYNLETFYRELIELNNNDLNIIIANSILSPTKLLLNSDLISTVNNIELLTRLFTIGNCLLSFIKKVNKLNPLKYYIDKLINVNLYNSSDGETADNECIVSYYSLIAQHMVQCVDNNPSEVRTISQEELEKVFIYSYTQNRLSLICKLMTEDVDIGLISLSEDNNTEYSILTSALDILHDYFYENINLFIHKYLNDSSIEIEIKSIIKVIISASSICSHEYVEKITYYLTIDLMYTLMKTSRHYCSELNQLLANKQSLLITNIDNLIYSFINDELPLIENWFKAFVISTLLNFSETHYKLVVIQICNNWIDRNNQILTKQALFVFSSILKIYFGLVTNDAKVIQNEEEIQFENSNKLINDLLFDDVQYYQTFDKLMKCLVNNTKQIVMLDWVSQITAYAAAKADSSGMSE